MELSSTQIKGAVVISIVGSLDALTAGQVAGYFLDRIHAGQRRMVADLSGVDFLSSAGLRAIMAVAREIRRQGGDFHLSAPQPGVCRVLRLAGFPNILKIYPTVEEAVASFNGAAGPEPGA